MSVTRTVTVWCDRCADWWADATLAKVRRLLKKKKWVHKGNKDYCPQCIWM